jgi:hypothetical protein
LSCHLCQGVRTIAQTVSSFVSDLLAAVYEDEVGRPLEPVVARAGQVFRCAQGHAMCEAIGNIRRNELRWSQKIGRWRNGVKPPAHLGDPLPHCPRCGTAVVLWIDVDGVRNGYAGFLRTPK